MQVLGIQLYDMGMKNAVQHVSAISQMIHGKNNRCISATGAHGLIIAKKSKHFAEILNSFYINLPDGRPGAIVGRLKGAKNMEQCTGPDFFKNLIETSASTDAKHFFCGGKQGVAEELKITCEKKYNNQNIVGIYSPPFREMTVEEMKALGEDINAKDVDIVWIGLSTPKQEFFANELRNYVNVHFIITVGAAFDFHTGRLKKAPRFITKMGLEWFFRLCMEPRRLWRRYFEIVPKFIYYSIVELINK